MPRAGREGGWIQTPSGYEGSHGLLNWNTVTGEVCILTRVTPATRPDTYWTASAATDLIN